MQNYIDIIKLFYVDVSIHCSQLNVIICNRTKETLITRITSILFNFLFTRESIVAMFQYPLSQLQAIIKKIVFNNTPLLNEHHRIAYAHISKFTIGNFQQFYVA